MKQPTLRYFAETKLLSALLLGLAAPLATFAATATWNGAGGNNLWSTAGNWGGTAPGAGDDLVFTGTVNRGTSNDFTAATSFSSFTLNTAGWTLAGSSVTLSGNITQNYSQASSGSNIISLPLILSGATEIFLSNASGSNFRLDISGAISGSGSITKTGGSTLRLGGTAGQHSYSGGLTVNAGTVDLQADNLIPSGAGKGNVTIAAGAFINSANFNQTINGLNGAGSITRSGSNTRTLQIGGGDASGSFTGNITWGAGSSGVTKIGTGTQTFGGAISTINFNVNGGTAIVNGTVAGTTTVGTAGTLGGTGTISSAATVNGALRPNSAPANSTSRLAFSSTLTLGTASTTTIDLDGANYTGVTSTGVTTFNGTLDIKLISTLAAGSYSYNLFDFGGQSGRFTSIGVTSFGSLLRDEAANGSGTWIGTYGLNTFQFTESDGVLGITVSAVPEPSAAALLAGVFGLGAAGLRRRRRAA